VTRSATPVGTEPGPAPPQATAPRRRPQSYVGWLFLAPVVIGVTVFQFVPLVASMGASLTQWNGFSAPRFVGFANFVEMFTSDPIFMTTLRNTLLFSAASIPLTVGLGLVLALLCQSRVRGVGLFRTAFFAPYVTNVVAIGFVFFWFFHPSQGVVNGLLQQVGVDGPAWLSDADWALPAVVLVSVWQGAGYPMVILLAGLQRIPTTLYEAATLDGARWGARVRHVTIPLLTPYLFFLLVTQFISSFQVFGLIYVMTGGGPGNATSVYIYYLFENAFTFGRVGYASAMAWILFVFITLATLVQWRFQRRWVFYE
jgi:multiple sugar transport system permease protein